MVDFLKEFTHSTAAYIGKLVMPKKKIQDNDDENAHIDESSNKIIHFMKSTKGHEFMVDKILQTGQGLTFDLFIEEEPIQYEQ